MGSGKTKLAETLSEVVHIPMHQVNCSVDLDAESLLGFKTIKTNDQGDRKLFSLTDQSFAERRSYFIY